ncbi:hypothetical protein [Pelagerythrobacter marensis]|uniref:hypothetical protein n=1 Tax=Pelagerythrobacter marensis TaxID=543877 RepID=UPI0012E032B7|nr:hypothetical protein [Pelagerythrobacter marensis]
MIAITSHHHRHAELVSASTRQPAPAEQSEEWTLKQVQGDVSHFFVGGGSGR